MRQNRMRWLSVLTLVGLLSACGASGQGERPVATTGAWTRLEDAPLSLRLGPVVATVDGKVVVVGGDTGPPCPPNASCVGPPLYARDGAVLDVSARRWLPMADAPVGIADHAPHAVVGSSLYVSAADRLWRFDLAEDAWQQIPTPPKSLQWHDLVGADHRLLLVTTSDEQVVQQDQVLNTRTGRWSALPEDPLGLSFDRSLTPTPKGLVLTAKQILANGQPADPAVTRAALLPRGTQHWRSLPDDRDSLAGPGWTWTGRRLVNPALGGADGGEVNNYGRIIAFGGRLNPATGTWSRLPHPPAEFSGGWPVYALQGPVIASAGWLYDDSAETWKKLSTPGGAPAAPGPATWVGHRLVVVGGEDNDPDHWTPEDVYDPSVWMLAVD